jgi:hypothetical protein
MSKQFFSLDETLTFLGAKYILVTFNVNIRKPFGVIIII